MPNFCFDGAQVIGRDNMINLAPLAVVTKPLAKIDMQTEAESRISPTLLNGLHGGVASHHQAGAGHNSVLISVKNAAISRGAEPEVVGIDDQRSICCHTTYLVASTKRLSRSRRSSSTISGQ